MRCGFPHLSLEEVKALKKEYPGECKDGSGRPCVQCDNSWFDGTCYHKDRFAGASLIMSMKMITTYGLSPAPHRTPQLGLDLEMMGCVKSMQCWMRW